MDYKCFCLKLKKVGHNKMLEMLKGLRGSDR